MEYNGSSLLHLTNPPIRPPKFAFAVRATIRQKAVSKHGIVARPRRTGARSALV